MHRTLTAVVALICSTSICSMATAQESVPTPPPDTTLQIDPLTTALGFVHIQLERALSDSISVYVGPSLHLFPGILQEDGEDRWIRCYGGEFGLRYFFGGSAQSGGWVQVRGVAAWIEGVNTAVDGEDEPTELGGYISVLGGYTWILDSGLLFSGGGGVQYVDYAIGDVGTRGVLPALHTTVGFAF
ncbi:MAG: hypothetical protein AAFX99_22275 [Myxococcota bacterium]